MENWIAALKEHNETACKKASIALEQRGEECFEAVVELLEHPIGKWHAIPLLMRLSPARAIPYLLDIVNRDRENSVRFKEHSRKYIRIKAINVLGSVGVRDNTELESLYTEYQVVDTLGYFIDLAHPHKHDEVIFAVKKALAVIGTDRARNILQGIP